MPRRFAFSHGTDAEGSFSLIFREIMLKMRVLVLEIGKKYSVKLAHTEPQNCRLACAGEE